MTDSIDYEGWGYFIAGDRLKGLICLVLKHAWGEWRHAIHWNLGLRNCQRCGMQQALSIDAADVRLKLADPND